MCMNLLDAPAEQFHPSVREEHQFNRGTCPQEYSYSPTLVFGSVELVDALDFEQERNTTSLHD